MAADWRKVALAAFQVDAQISDETVKVLKKALWADGKIDVDEVEFLIDLRNTAAKRLKAKGEALNAKFEKLFFDAIEANVLGDGKISANETSWLRKALLADGKIDDSEWALLERLKKKATSVAAEFDALFTEFKGKREATALKAAKAAAKK